MITIPLTPDIDIVASPEEPGWYLGRHSDGAASVQTYARADIAARAFALGLVEWEGVGDLNDHDAILSAESLLDELVARSFIAEAGAT